MSPSPDSLAARLRQVRLARRADRTPRKAATWDLVKVALMVPAGTVVAIGAVLALIRLLAGDGLAGLGSATASGWLAVNQVPTTIGGVTVGVLPLLPTLVVAACTAAVVAEGASTARELPDLAGLVGAALGGPLLVTALSLAVVADGSAVTSIGQPDSLPAFGYTLLVQGVAVAIGVAVPSLAPILDEFAVPATDRVGARGGLIAFLVLAAGGAMLTLIGIVVHWGAVADTIADGNTVDGYLGLTGLSILYLPNVALGAAAVTTGAGAQLGGAAFDAFDVVPGAMPPLPILSALPATGVGGLGAFYFVVPIAAGAVLGWYCRSDDPMRHLRAVGVGAAVAAGLVVLTTWLAGGRLGELGHAGADVPTSGVYTFAWTALVGALVVGVMRLADGGVPRLRPSGSSGAADDLDDWLDDGASDRDEPGTARDAAASRADDPDPDGDSDPDGEQATDTARPDGDPAAEDPDEAGTTPDESAPDESGPDENGPDESAGDDRDPDAQRPGPGTAR